MRVMVAFEVVQTMPDGSVVTFEMERPESVSDFRKTNLICGAFAETVPQMAFLPSPKGEGDPFADAPRKSQSLTQAICGSRQDKTNGGNQTKGKGDPGYNRHGHNLRDELAKTREAIAELTAILAGINHVLDGPDAKARAIQDELRETHARPLLDSVARARRRPLFRELSNLSDRYGADRQRRRELTGQIKALARERDGLERRIAKQPKEASK